MKIPPKGLSKEEIFQTLQSYKSAELDWKSGRVFGYIYDAGKSVHKVINDAYTLYLYKNKELRKHQIWACSRWAGYTVINPAVTSSKSGGPTAAAWAVLKYKSFPLRACLVLR